jgi:hypothetical protein
MYHIWAKHFPHLAQHPSIYLYPHTPSIRTLLTNAPNNPAHTILHILKAPRTRKRAIVIRKERAVMAPAGFVEAGAAAWLEGWAGGWSNGALADAAERLYHDCVCELGDVFCR